MRLYSSDQLYQYLCIIMLFIRQWNSDILSVGVASLAEEMVIKPDAPGGMPDYRLCLALSFFYKFYLTVTSKLKDIPSNELTATEVHV